MDEAMLLRSYAGSRDAEAFARIVSRYEGMVFATCRRQLHDAGEVEDAVQEVFLRLAQKAGNLRTNLGGWLHRCAVNVSLDLNRRRESRGRREAAVAKHENTASPQAALGDLREDLDSAMERLDAEARELIIQRYFVGRSQTELAAEARVAPSTMAHRLQQAVEKLRKQLKSPARGATLGAAILIAALEAEKASAAVPPALQANVMKIGLTGAGPAARAGLTWLAKTGIGAGALAAIALALWLWLGHKSPAPTPTAHPAEPVLQAQSGDTADDDFGQPQAPVDVQIRLWRPEGSPETGATVQLIDWTGQPITPSQPGSMRFRTRPGRYWLTIKRQLGEPDSRLIRISDNGGPIDILLR